MGASGNGQIRGHERQAVHKPACSSLAIHCSRAHSTPWCMSPHTMQRRLFVVAHPRVCRMSSMRFRKQPHWHALLKKYKRTQTGTLVLIPVLSPSHPFWCGPQLGLDSPNTFILQDRAMDERQGFEAFRKRRVLMRFWEQIAKTEEEESPELPMASNTSGIVMEP